MLGYEDDKEFVVISYSNLVTIQVSELSIWFLVMVYFIIISLYLFVRVFNPLKLQFIVTIPKPHFLGVNVAEGIDSR